jgi:hypothetical protein
VIITVHIETRVQKLLRRRNMLLTKGGELTEGETLWLIQIENELGI